MMVDELAALQSIQQAQKKWRRIFQVVFIVIVLISTVLFVVFPKIFPPLIMQIILLFTMGSVFGLFFLDRISHMINKKRFKQDIVHKYLYQHLKPDDVHRDPELVVELISKRRKNSKEMRSV